MDHRKTAWPWIGETLNWTCKQEVWHSIVILKCISVSGVAMAKECQKEMHLGVVLGQSQDNKEFKGRETIGNGGIDGTTALQQRLA